MPAFATWARFADEQTRLPAVIAEEKREDAAAAAAHEPKPKHPWHPQPESWQPGALYNGMIAPLTPYSIKGVIWYQGETNSSPERAPLYEKLFSTMITGWRSAWQQGEFPFLFVQISSFNSPGESWGRLRDQQRRTLAVANTAMAVTLDVGQADNVHPPDKQTVGARLAVAALATVYGQPVEYSGPLFRQAVPEGGAMRVSFSHAAGLRAHGDTLVGFEVAGKDHTFYPAKASIADGCGGGRGRRDQRPRRRPHVCSLCLGGSDRREPLQRGRSSCIDVHLGAVAGGSHLVRGHQSRCPRACCNFMHLAPVSFRINEQLSAY